MPEPSHIRNFSIVAHIDHGKSTLADRLLQATRAVDDRESREQFLDSMDLERERGITIKASAVTVRHRHTDGHDYMLNFIDTPGHVDFGYEVSRALKACEGALLVVDAAQGVEAQTVVNAYLAIEQDLEIIPVLNKIDLPGARPDEIAEEIEQVLGLDAEDCIACSAKSGVGIEELLGAICDRLPPPRAQTTDRTRALIFDAVYDDYRGVILYCRVFDGRLRVGDKIRMMQMERTFQVTELGKYTPKPLRVDEVGVGEACYLVAAIKNLGEVRVGDTITLDHSPASEPLSGYEPPKQMVFCDFFPVRGKGGVEEKIEVHNPADLPEAGSVLQVAEPICKLEIMLPKDYIGDVMKLCLDRRASFVSQMFVSDTREMLTFEIPLAELIYDFYDKLKGMTSGYATMDYEVVRYQPDNLVKVDILINGEPVPALSLITHRDKAEQRGRAVIAKLKKQIDRHQFEIPLQAAIGGKIIARETIKAYRKDVTAKCYGGDVTRKRKLMEKQKKGKERMKAVGSVNIPQQAFMAVLDTGE